MTNRPDQFRRAKGSILEIEHQDWTGELLNLKLHVHPGENFLLGTIDAMKTFKGIPVLPYFKNIFGPAPNDEESKDFHANGYGLSFAAYANQGATLHDGT